MAEKITRIHWRDEEWAQAFSEYFRLDKLNLFPPGSNSQERWEQAQKVLPEERRRSMKNSSTSSALNKAYQEALVNGEFKALEAELGRPKAIQPAPPVLPPDHTDEVVVVNGTPVMKTTYKLIEDDILKKRPPPSLEGVLTTFLKSLIKEVIVESRGEIVGDVVRGMHEITREQHIALMRQIDPAWEEPKPVVQEEHPLPGKPRRPVVVLMHAISSQFDAVAREFPMFNVVGYRDQVPPLQDAMLVVGFEKFMGHDLIKKCKQKFGERYVGHQGAATQAATLIKARLGHLIQPS